MSRLKNDTFLRALLRQPTEYTPVWLMRQAGRYLSEYRAVREKAGGFLDLCRTPELACEVTIQPIDLLNVDAAILFSDILVPLPAMGVPLAFEEGEGPKLEPVRSAYAVEKLCVPDPLQETGYVMDAVRLIRKELDGRVPLIGFAGAPFTLASYAIEGGTSRNFRHTLAWMYAEPESFRLLLDKMADTVILYLKAQVEAGAQAFQLFDSWAGVLSRKHYREFALPATAKIFSALKGLGVPMILYVNGSAPFLEELGLAGADVVSVDWRVSLGEANERLRGAVGLQGNLDPMALYAPKEILRQEVAKVMGQAPSSGHIFNLGHGVLPDTPRDAAKAVVEMVHELGKRGI